MKVIKVLSEQWFKKASFDEVRLIAVRHLNIPADVMNDSHKEENFKRAMARQVFNKEHEYPKEFEIVEISNPFGKVPKRRTSTAVAGGLTGEYRFIKCGMRAPEDDIRWQMMKTLENHNKFEDALKEWDKTTGVKTRFQSTGKSHTFNFVEMVQWALKRGWIERV
jgi:hypothetical protein